MLAKKKHDIALKKYSEGAVDKEFDEDKADARTTLVTAYDSVKDLPRGMTPKQVSVVYTSISVADYLGIDRIVTFWIQIYVDIQNESILFPINGRMVGVLCALFCLLVSL